MIRSTLDYLRGAADREPMVTLDLAAQLDSVVQDQNACGYSVWLAQAAAPSSTPIVRAQTVALRRCIDNLVHNAVLYGGHAEVARAADAQQLAVCPKTAPASLPPYWTRCCSPFSSSRTHATVAPAVWAWVWRWSTTSPPAKATD